MKIYLVTAHGGYYEDAWKQNIKAFSTKESAEKFKQQCEAEDKEYIDKLTRIIDEFTGKSYRVVDLEMTLSEIASFYDIESVDYEC